MRIPSRKMPDVVEPATVGIGLATAERAWVGWALTVGSGLLTVLAFPNLNWGLLGFVSLSPYRGSVRDPVYYHVAKGRVTEPVLRGLGLAYAVANPLEPIAPQVGHAAAWAEESSSPFVLLLSKEDIKW